MNRHKTLALSLLLVCALGSWVMWVNSNSLVRGQSQPPLRGDNQVVNPFARLDDKARAAKGGGETQVRELTDEILSSSNLDQAPAGMADAIKARLVRAEVNYRNGRSKAISEFDVIRMVNMVAQKTGAPDFAKTNVFEVRRLQLGILPFVPNLLARTRDGLENDGRPRGAAVNSAMSPLEATFVATLLLQQKRHNAEYQLTHDEWVALHGSKRKGASNEKFQEQMKAHRKNSNRTDELDRAMARGLTAMSPVQLLSLPEELLDRLGVER